jgi:demethylmenaquinone methyltransferase/2-methoxy-6-polyprenyl-1,4-benzoquinol methylase
VCFVDSLYERTSSAVDHGPADHSGVVRRRLGDGREFEVVKVFYEPEALADRLRQGGWEGWVRSTGRFFLVGSVTHLGSGG